MSYDRKQSERIEFLNEVGAVRCANIEHIGGKKFEQALKFQRRRFSLGRAKFCLEQADARPVETENGDIVPLESRHQHHLILMSIIHYCAAVANENGVRAKFTTEQKTWHEIFDNLRNGFAAHDDGSRQFSAPFAFLMLATMSYGYASKCKTTYYSRHSPELAKPYIAASMLL